MITKIIGHSGSMIFSSVPDYKKKLTLELLTSEYRIINWRPITDTMLLSYHIANAMRRAVRNVNRDYKNKS